MKISKAEAQLILARRKQAFYSPEDKLYNGIYRELQLMMNDMKFLLKTPTNISDMERSRQRENFINRYNKFINDTNKYIRELKKLKMLN